MKVQLYSEGLRFIAKSGVGKAIKHQQKALEVNHIPCQINGYGFDYDVIHINTVGLVSVMRAFIARLRGKKVVVHAHSTAEDFRNSFFFADAIAPLFKRWISFVYKQGDVIVTPTPYSKKLLSTYNLNRHIEVVSNGVEIEKFAYDANSAKQFRDEYGFSDEDKIVLSVGLQIRRKGIHDFIEIANELPDYKFMWCGYTSPYLVTKDIREAIQSAPDNVYFPGYLNNLLGAYSGADVFFMPTYEETEGIVMLEALANERPIVVRDIPCYDEWLTDGLDCYKGHDNETFRMLIEQVASRKLKDLTQEGYEVVKERSLEKVGYQLQSIYMGLVGEVRHEI